MNSTRDRYAIFVSSIRNRYSIIFASFMILCCCGAIGVLYHNVIRGAFFTNPQELKKTQGVIVSSDLRTHYNKGRTSFNYLITYNYQVGQNSYFSDQITFSNITGSEDETFALSYLKKYPIDRKIVVFYDPKDAAFSVLEPTVKDGVFALVCILVTGTLACLYGFMWGYRGIRQYKISGTTERIATQAATSQRVTL